MKKFKVFRYAVLMEDEGHEQSLGTVEAESKADAVEKAAGPFKDDSYFKAGDYYALEIL